MLNLIGFASLRYAVIRSKSGRMRQFPGLDTSRFMEHDTRGFARILKEYGSVSWDFRATTRLFSRSGGFTTWAIWKGWEICHSTKREREQLYGEYICRNMDFHWSICEWNPSKTKKKAFTKFKYLTNGANSLRHKLLWALIKVGEETHLGLLPLWSSRVPCHIQ